MSLTLKQFLEVYAPKSGGERNFVAKHVVVKSGDPEKNGDKTFKATNVKPVERTPDHGYNPGEDEQAYS